MLVFMRCLTNPGTDLRFQLSNLRKMWRVEYSRGRFLRCLQMLLPSSLVFFPDGGGWPPDCDLRWVAVPVAAVPTFSPAQPWARQDAPFPQAAMVRTQWSIQARSSPPGRGGLSISPRVRAVSKWMVELASTCESSLILLVLSNDGGDGVFTCDLLQARAPHLSSKCAQPLAGDAELPRSEERNEFRCRALERRSVVEPKLERRHRLPYPMLYLSPEQQVPPSVAPGKR